MNFTSFNPIQIQQTNSTQNQPLTLKKGQVLHGTIKKLYPDQIAEVQVGGHKLIAKLETPLKAGDSHFFQVMSISPQAELKVVSGPMNASSSMSQQIHQLVDSMNLPKSADVMQLVSHFIKEQVPISKEQLLQAQSILNSNDGLSKQDAIVVLQKMTELKMPFTNEVFQAILNGSKTSGISQVIDSFTQLLLKDQSIAENTKTAILQNLERIAKPLDAQMGGQILSKVVHTLLSEPSPIANKLHALNLLKEASIIPKQATLSNWMQTQSSQIGNANQSQSLHTAGDIIRTIRNMNEGNATTSLNQVKSWIENESNLSQSQKSEILAILNRFGDTPKQAQNIEQFAKHFNELLLKAYSSNSTNQNSTGENVTGQLMSLIKQDVRSNDSLLLSNLVKVTSESTQPQIQTLYQQVEQQMKAALDGHAVQQAMKTVLKSLGISYESALNQNLQEIDQVSDGLKPQVLSMIKDGFVSPPLKEAAEVLLARMNGMQLLSGENGPQQQIVMQIPLQFFGKSMDATLQWNGRMNENGKIDSNYARILFYLDMESLKETVVDMQVQNRIVTINLFNEDEYLSTIAEPLQNLLKDRLTEKGYYLSGIFYKAIEENSANPSAKIGRKEKNGEATRFNGVDIRI